MTRIGYAHLDVNDQDYDRQVARLEAAASQIVRSEVGAGSMQAKRIELEAVVQLLQAGDELVVLRLDQIAHSARDA